MPKLPLALIIFDGFGIAAPDPSNAVTRANLPYSDRLVRHFPTFALQASGEAVGLRWGEIGNSEAGHLNIGAGRIVWQSYSRINRAITDGSFFKNKKVLEGLVYAREQKSAVHILGLLSQGGIHCDKEHILALAEMAVKAGCEKIYLHLFLDGRDGPFQEALSMIEGIQKQLKKSPVQIASVTGRFFAMDRDKHWDRTESAYNAIVLGQAESSTTNINEILREYYKEGNDDEHFPATVILGADKQPIGKAGDNDVFIMANFRADRARQMCWALQNSKEFEQFKRPVFSGTRLYTMVNYDIDLPADGVILETEEIKNPLAEILANAGLRQLHIAETEKYAHVTYFFNGGHEEPYSGEVNELVPSKRVANFVDAPEMSAQEITAKVLQHIENNEFDFYVINFANADLLGHTGDLKATIKGLEIMDECLRQIGEAILAKRGQFIVTADHGNCEGMMNAQTGEKEKEHSTAPVWFVLAGEMWEDKMQIKLNNIKELIKLTPSGFLADIAPTIIKLLDLKKPKDMSGQSLI